MVTQKNVRNKFVYLVIFSICMIWFTADGVCQDFENLALEKPVWISGGAGQGGPELLTDGETASDPYLGGPTRVQIDLEEEMVISVIKIWHYWQDGRTYQQNRVAVTLEDKKASTFEQYEPDEIVFDSDVDGEYPESAEGKTIEFEPREVQYIHAWVGGSDANEWSHWVEIQAFNVPSAVDFHGKISTLWSELKSK